MKHVLILTSATCIAILAIGGWFLGSGHSGKWLLKARPQTLAWAAPESAAADRATTPAHQPAAGENPNAKGEPKPKPAPRPVPDLPSVAIRDVPHVQQKPDFCGEACAEMFLRKLGKTIDQDDVFNVSGLDPVEGRGCYTGELQTALQRIGFRIGNVWFSIDPADEIRQTDAAFAAMHADLVAGVPSIVCMHYDDQPETTEHFRLVLGYDRERDEVIYHEPAVRRGAYLRMKRTKLLELWPLKYEEQRWTLIRFRLEPGRLSDVPRTPGYDNADYAQHVLRLKRKLPGDDFQILLRRPFVIVGNQSPGEVEQWADGTIQWAVSRIKRDYFPRDPYHILDIWLFKDKDSYEAGCKQVFGFAPSTPFGFYSRTHRALVMNIDTGGGTLVHELVHPFIESNFPNCPSWFNEGLASLYEQCGDRNGHIWGYTNWRLRGLQGVIGGRAEYLAKQASLEKQQAALAAKVAQAKRKRHQPADEVAAAALKKLVEQLEQVEAELDELVPISPLSSFEELCNTTTREFYNDWRGTNYAQARYLCYYLQQHGLLVKYYQAFRAAAADDPSGYETLKKVLGTDDMAAFQKQWEAYVMSLRF